MNLHHYVTAVIAAVILLSFSSAQAQEAQPESTAVAAHETLDKGPEDALGRGNPHDSIVGYLDAASAFQWEKAAEYLDLRNLPEEVSEIGGPELARQFNHVLSRAVWFDDYSVSNAAEGARGDGLPEYRDELLTITTPEGQVPIWIQRVPRGDGE
jgi:MscS family membrane protein